MVLQYVHISEVENIPLSGYTVTTAIRFYNIMLYIPYALKQIFIITCHMICIILVASG